LAERGLAGRRPGLERLGGGGEDEVGRGQLAHGDTVQHHQIAVPQVDRPNIAVLDEVRLGLGKGRENAGQLYLVDPHREVADHIAASADLEDESVCPTLTEQHVASALAVEGIVAGAAKQEVGDGIAGQQVV
jgi:hypothetical protein